MTFVAAAKSQHLHDNVISPLYLLNQESFIMGWLLVKPLATVIIMPSIIYAINQGLTLIYVVQLPGSVLP